MFNAIVFILFGAFIGWATPQPEWAKKIQSKVSSYVGSWFIGWFKK